MPQREKTIMSNITNKTNMLNNSSSSTDSSKKWYRSQALYFSLWKGVIHAALWIVFIRQTKILHVAEINLYV
jgi:hypothetical protein